MFSRQPINTTPISDVIAQKQEYIYLYLTDMAYLGKAVTQGNQTVELFMGAAHEVGATWKVTTVHHSDTGTLTSINYTTLVEAVPFRRVTAVGSRDPPRKANLENLRAYCTGKMTQTYILTPTQGGVLMEFDPPLGGRVSPPRGSLMFRCCFGDVIQQHSRARVDQNRRAIYSALEGLTRESISHFDQVLQTNPLFTSATQRVQPEKMMDASSSAPPPPYVDDTSPSDGSSKARRLSVEME